MRFTWTKLSDGDAQGRGATKAADPRGGRKSAALVVSAVDPMNTRPAELSDPARLRVRQILRGKRLQLGRTAGELAVRAAFEIRRAHQTEHPTDEERVLWEGLVINDRHVGYFENFPAAPMSTPIRRARLLGISMALGLDAEERAELNRIGGGI